jgi:hypothetical protein
MAPLRCPFSAPVIFVLAVIVSLSERQLFVPSYPRSTIAYEQA